MKTIRSKKILTPHGWINGVIKMENGYILSVEEGDADSDEDYGELSIIPGIFDIHNHGYGGWSVTDPIEVEEVRGYAKILPSLGITSVMATAKEPAMKAVGEYMKDPDSHAARIQGIYSEGPFWARAGEKSGNLTFPSPNIEKVQQLWELSNHEIKMMGIAPELPHAQDVIEYLHTKKIKVAAAHTKATAEQIREKLYEIDHVTHLGNGMSGIHHRNMGALGQLLLARNLHYEIIADLNHVCWEMLALMFQCQSFEKFMLISDSCYLAGLPQGRYCRNGREVNVYESGLILDDNGRICGSGKYVLYNMRMLKEKLHIPLEIISLMASWVPANYLSLEDQGVLEKGMKADFIVLDEALSCKATYIGGTCVYRQGDKVIINEKRMSSSWVKEISK